MQEDKELITELQKIGVLKNKIVCAKFGENRLAIFVVCSGFISLTLLLFSIFKLYRREQVIKLY